jgi:hypothetical protein
MVLNPELPLWFACIASTTILKSLSKTTWDQPLFTAPQILPLEECYAFENFKT